MEGDLTIMVRNEDNMEAALRIIDVNVNRCAEGLRVIEEVARFILEDEELVRGIKSLRHDVRKGTVYFTDSLSTFRDVENDPGSSFSSTAELSRSGIYDITKSNFSRVAEALRVIEEFGKLINTDGAEYYKSLRFRVYQLERNFLGEIDTSVHLPDCPFLYAILDRSFVPEERLENVVDQLLEGGAQMIQYRAKGITRAEAEIDLFRLLGRASEYGVPVIVNDDPSLAAEVGAHGVHLGKDDTPVERAREILGETRIIGVTVHSFEELVEVNEARVDYLAVGAIFHSETKPEVATLGVKELSRYVEHAKKPVVAIGGINRENLQAVLDSGVCGVAAISAILTGDVKKNCMDFRKIIDKAGKIE